MCSLDYLDGFGHSLFDFGAAGKNSLATSLVRRGLTIEILHAIDLQLQVVLIKH